MDKSQFSSFDDGGPFFILRQRIAKKNEWISLRRAAICFGVGLALISLVCGLNQQSAKKNASALELYQTALHSSAKIDADLVTATEKSKSDTLKSLAAEKTKLSNRMKTLKASVVSEAKAASALEDQLVKDMSSLRGVLITAKDDRAVGDDLEKEAKKRVNEAAKDRKSSEELKHQSDAAKRAFVAEEKPIELAMKLSDHDSRAYRKMQLEIAKDVTIMSDRPNDFSLKASLRKLIKNSRKDARRVSEDSNILSTLQERSTHASLDGVDSFASLKQNSVKLAKEAEVAAQAAVSFAQRGQKQRVKATDLASQVESGLVKPDEEQAKADALRVKYATQMSELEREQARLKAISKEQARLTAPPPAPPPPPPAAKSSDESDKRRHDPNDVRDDKDDKYRRHEDREHDDDNKDRRGGHEDHRDRDDKDDDDSHSRRQERRRDEDEHDDDDEDKRRRHESRHHDDDDSNDDDDSHKSRDRGDSGDGDHRRRKERHGHDDDDDDDDDDSRKAARHHHGDRDGSHKADEDHSGDDGDQNMQQSSGKGEDAVTAAEQATEKMEDEDMRRERLKEKEIERKEGDPTNFDTADSDNRRRGDRSSHDHDDRRARHGGDSADDSGGDSHRVHGSGRDKEREGRDEGGDEGRHAGARKATARSNYLMGLFSGTAPWDKSDDRGRR